MTVDKKKGPVERKKPFKPQVAYDKDVLLSSNDKVLREVAELSETSKLLDAYLPMLEQGTRRPICPRYDTLKETGRTSSHGTRKKKKKKGDNIVVDGTNIQNPPRKGGVRECFIPRPGSVYVACDYSVLELRTLAQVCIWLLGVSTLAEVFRNDGDPHVLMASQLLGLSYEETLKRYKARDKMVVDARQVSKPINFGFPGGLGAKTFVDYLRNYDRDLFFEMNIDEEKAKALREAWFGRYPEMREYFKYISHLVESGEDGADVHHPGSERMRGRVRFCATANGFFQGLAADLAKEALRNVVRECYVDKTSALYGSRVTMFIHDEIVIESPREGASRAAKRLEEVMVTAGQKWCPDVPIKATAVMMERWYKGADPMFDDEKNLVPWSPELVGALALAKGCAELAKRGTTSKLCGDSKAFTGDCTGCGKKNTWVICRPHPPHPAHGARARGLCADCEFVRT
jgi:DNA polymerase I-like protein with 3'-5' exonuclease and polymerase domains